MTNKDNSNPQIHNRRPDGTFPHRPKGSKDSYKRATLYQKAQAKAMYLSGQLPDDIAKELSLGSSEVITNWAKKEMWIEERDKVLQKTTADRLQELLKQQEDKIRELREIQDKAFKSISGETPAVQPQKFSEASNAYINALEMERKIKIEALQVSFISDVAQILKEEVQDRNLLMKIADRFRGLFQKYQQKSLDDGRNIKEE